MSPGDCILPEDGLEIVSDFHTLGERLEFIDNLQQLLAFRIQERYSCLVSSEWLAASSNFFIAVLAHCLVTRVADQCFHSALAGPLLHVLD